MNYCPNGITPQPPRTDSNFPHDAKGKFIGPGDSGALLVTDPDRCPVGLCFAGNRSGTSAVANPIACVLIALSLELDPFGETILEIDGEIDGE